MEKSNELNKLLSYIHMGESVYRIYHKQAELLNDIKLLEKIVKIEEMFKKHEESITQEISKYDEESTDSLTFAGIIGVYKEKLKNYDDAYSICINAIKTTNMGMVSTIKFLNENSNLPKNIKELIKNIIIDYANIEKKLVEHILEN